jgi:hypothetical protein
MQCSSYARHSKSAKNGTAETIAGVVYAGRPVVAIGAMLDKEQEERLDNLARDGIASDRNLSSCKASCMQR